MIQELEEYMVPRPAYMHLLEPYIGTEQVKVLQGIRRSGKSSILRMLHSELCGRGIEQRNIFIKRFDEFGLPATMDAQALTQQLAAALEAGNPSQMFYVFLDEVQQVQDWQNVVRGLHTKRGVDVYITGSNAHLLSSDLATQLAGRTITIDVFPLSFEEYLRFTAEYNEREGADKTNGQSRSRDDLFSTYLRFGGMPSLFSLREFSLDGISRELSSIYNTVILNDVAQRMQIRDITLLNRLVAYLFSTSGNLFSMRKLVGSLASAGRRTSVETVDSYIDALERAFILHGVPQSGLQGKRLMNPLRKFYPVDTGLRNLAGGFSGRDLGFQLENVVANELLRRGWTVTVGALSGSEVDFVACKLDQREYIQVTQTMVDTAVYRRELEPLRTISDAFPKIVLTLDRYRVGTTEDGIRVINIIDWLLGRDIV